MKVLLGLSGGVDSAVAARLLQEAGHTVHGHWLDIGLGGRAAAAAVAAELGIDFSVGDIREALEEKVCRPFAAQYLAGETPLPCARCNAAVKFPALLEAAERLGAACVATGHYARIAEEAGEVQLLRGQPANDQSYMLARLPKAMLPKLLFPLAALDKRQVRERARGYGLRVSEQPDSMDICFIPDGDYAAWLARRGETPPPGDFVNAAGELLGRHKGIHHYTLGQRRGLGVPAAQRLFVSALIPERNEVRLSDGSDLFARTVFCRELNLLAPISPQERVSVRLRHSKEEYPARLRPTAQGLRIETEVPARAPAPGQLAVFYRGERLLGSGWIVGAERLPS